MLIYGLTGGTGSGKSEAAKRFAERGIVVIDADRVGHAAIAPGGAAEAAVIDAFGSAILSCGKIDRDALGAQVFGDADARRRLNAIVHPVIFAEIARQCERFEEEGRKVVLIDAALLAEHGVREPWLAGLVLVVCPRPERVRRLAAYRGIRPEEAERRMDAQSPPEAKTPLADWVIENAGSLESLYARVDEIAKVMRHAALGS